MIRLDSVTKRDPNGYVAVETLSMDIPSGKTHLLGVLNPDSVYGRGVDPSTKPTRPPRRPAPASGSPGAP
jgi:hypothetical protein